MNAEDPALMKISNSLPSATSVSQIRGHFAKYKLNQKDLATVYAYWLMNHIDYDCKRFTSGDVEDFSTSVLLAEKKAVCYGYSKLMSELCNSSGIHCYVVKGFAKGYGFNPKSIPATSNHAWNVIKADTQYFLMDITWAAGYVDNSGSQLRFVRQLDFNRLFAEPGSFISDHMPFVPWFQLLSPTHSIASFFNMQRIAGRTDLSHVSEKTDFKARLDSMDVMDYASRTSLIIDAAERFFSRPVESATDMSFLAYQFMMRSQAKKDLLQSESMLLKAESYLKKTKGYTGNSLWPILEKNLEYCRFKLETAK